MRDRAVSIDRSSWSDSNDVVVAGLESVENREVEAMLARELAVAGRSVCLVTILEVSVGRSITVV